jgi:peptidoglycan/xylan/chitin deacetylase (PgdA/CDA1 family)
MIASRHIAALASAALLSIGLWASGAAAACPGALSERVLDLSDAGVTSFGTMQKLPALPLNAGEYVLTFDDGPRRETTPKILEELHDACLHATFFMIGQRAERASPIAKQVLLGGHSIGSHSYTHRNLTTLPFDEAMDDIKRGVAAVERAVYGNRMTPIRLFRFPDNAGTPALISAAQQLGLIIASYDISPEDWRNSPPEETMHRLRQRLNTVDRGVIVLHDVQDNTVPLVPMVLDELKKRGASIVHVVE